MKRFTPNAGMNFGKKSRRSCRVIFANQNSRKAFFMGFKRPANCSRNIFRNVERQAPPIQVLHSHGVLAFQRLARGKRPACRFAIGLLLLLPALVGGCGTLSLTG